MASEAKANEDLIIPTVTIDDLRAFHSAHFSSNLPDPTTGPHISEEEHRPEEDDGLGYYEDGVKRTLTAEQVALFRHSEIETLLREERHREEAEEYRVSQATEDLPAGESRQQTPNTAPRIGGQMKPNGRRGVAKRQKLSTKAVHISENDPQGRTHRRMARELDSVEEKALELDY